VALHRFFCEALSSIGSFDPTKSNAFSAAFRSVVGPSARVCLRPISIAETHAISGKIPNTRRFGRSVTRFCRFFEY
jgi:hypothetical protein